MDNRQSETSDGATNQQLMQMVTGFWVSRIVYLAAKLGIADCLADGPRGATDIAQQLSSAPRNLYRLMRALACVGVLRESADGHFSLTSLGELLRTDVRGSARNAVLAMCSDWMWRSWEHLPYAFATGETGMSKAFGMELFDYLAANPEEIRA